jgi:hypothetical protein
MYNKVRVCGMLICIPSGKEKSGPKVPETYARKVTVKVSGRTGSGQKTLVSDSGVWGLGSLYSNTGFGLFTK